MSAQTVAQATLCSLVMLGIATAANALTQEELLAKVKAAGYSQITNVKSTPEGISVRATKNGTEVSLVVDSSGQIKERH
jgi:hypothetical protein